MGLHGASIEAIAREAGITQAYVFGMFGTKKALFVELVGAAFDRFSDGMSQAAKGARGVRALALMGAQYYESLADRTTLLLQLQGFAACGDSEVRDLVRARVGRMWDTVADAAGLDPVTVKSFLAFGMLLNNVAGAALSPIHPNDDGRSGCRRCWPSPSRRAVQHQHRPGPAAGSPRQPPCGWSQGLATAQLACCHRVGTV
jgi:AcrR family transcriptional regulator